MKIYISCDIEGISGVVEKTHTKTTGMEYQRAREWMTNEVNAVVNAAFDCGAKRVLVNDSHGSMTNIIIDKLNPKATLISGCRKPLDMMQGIEEGFDAVAFVGYHAKMGTIGGVLDHTMYGQVVQEFKINNRLYGETGINALIAGQYKTPVVLVCGDDKTSREAKSFLGNVETVITKKGITRFAAELFHPEAVIKKITKSAKRAFTNYRKYKPFKMPGIMKLSIRFMNSAMADEAMTMPRARRADGFTVSYEAKDFIELYQVAKLMIMSGANLLPR